MFSSFISILHIFMSLSIPYSYCNFKKRSSFMLCFFHKKVNKINAKGTSQRVGFVAGQASANYR
ncbi:hypothetical protein CEV08_07525 [Bartonella tribocorum]|uniref:Uncharacterized protein n=1 Tax=Bartonella tribocorum TaxID=85701 RepID=A0A2N9Y8D1_9HYPH|nr:hypothetical protein [Bartonella tribocorum]PIT67964.1 hypothetical protein CEV08_08950 [Bartonella tribocorum]PIT68040.1 hypothetical protein CEV08_08780 [Bartonella tribocorum]PIT68774.1 hypothetical protein CEV08_07525 [Bartonella tribocorum]